MAARDLCLQKEHFLFKAFSKFWLSHPFLQIYLLRKMNLQLWTLTFFFQNQSSFKKWVSPPELINWIKVLFFPQVQVVIAANAANAEITVHFLGRQALLRRTAVMQRVLREPRKAGI